VVALLVLLFLVVPIAELAVILQVGHAIGVLNTLGALVLLSLAGAWLCKREGLGVMRRFRQQMEAGVVPGREVVDGALVLLAGALLLTPGFITDLVGLLLLLPPVRAGVRAAARRRVTARLHGWR
jgi:UPF0716 protein FxsA